MKKQILTLAVLSATSLTFLTACGSSPSADTNGVVGLPPTLSDRIASHRELGSFSNGGDIDDSSNNTFDYTNSQTEDTFTLHSRGDNLIMTVNGVQHVLTLVNGNTDEWENSDNPNISIGNFRGSYFQGDTILDTIAGKTGLSDGSYGTFAFYEVDTNLYDSGATDFDVDYRYGYVTVGVRTPETIVQEQTARATYSGSIRFLTDPVKRAERNLPSRLSYSGGISLEVDFDEKTIEGTATFRSSDDTHDVDSVIFAKTRINGNGFEGTFTLTEAVISHTELIGNPVGLYAGNFFGPSAENLAGVMQINSENTNGAVFGIGGFRGNRYNSQPN